MLSNYFKATITAENINNIVAIDSFIFIACEFVSLEFTFL